VLDEFRVVSKGQLGFYCNSNVPADLGVLSCDFEVPRRDDVVLDHTQLDGAMVGLAELGSVGVEDSVSVVGMPQDVIHGVRSSRGAKRRILRKPL